MDDQEKERRETFCRVLKELGWNQSQAGRELGVTSNLINMIVNGKCAPSQSLLKFIELKKAYQNAKSPALAEIGVRLERVPADQKNSAKEAVNRFLDGFAALKHN